VIAFAEDLARLKRQILELLEKDLEFRRAILGMLELERISEGLKRHDEKFEKLLESFNRHEAQLVKLREDMNKLREDMMLGFKRHDEILEKHAQEIVKLRESFNRMLSVIAQVQEEQRRLREGYERLERGLRSLEGGMLKGFAEMSKFAGITFEEFVRSFLTEALRSSGEIPEGAELRRAVVDGEEINIFLEDPLIVGEVTASAESVDEIMKLLRKAELARAKYSREPKMMMIALTAKRDVAREMERVAEERGVKLVIGKVVG
jgi:hypothetical protein